MHDRRAIAAGDFVLVGPAPRTAAAKAAAAGGPQRVEVLEPDPRSRRRRAGRASSFSPPATAPATHVAEQALWRAAGIAPAAPWYVNAGGSAGFAAKVRARGAYAVVERGAWSVAGGGLSVLAEGDPLLAESVHAMRSFRASHPAGKIFIAWIGGDRGHAVVASHRGYRRPA